MILVIDTTSKPKKIALYWPEKIKEVTSWESNQIDPLEKIDNILKSNNLCLKDLKFIVVNRGPGSFTGTRIGIVIANTLSKSLNIPIIGIINKKNLDIISLAKRGYKKKDKTKSSRLAVPYYGQEPNITKSLK